MVEEKVQSNPLAIYTVSTVVKRRAIHEFIVVQGRCYVVIGAWRERERAIMRGLSNSLYMFSDYGDVVNGGRVLGLYNSGEECEGRRERG